MARPAKSTVLFSATRRGPLAARLAELLPAHLRADGTLGALADDLGCSLAHASDLVRRLTGTSFVALRRAQRLAQARAMLARGASVKEAAFATGFRDPAYFGRVFRRHHGTSPARWVRTRATPHVAPRPRGVSS